MNKELDRMLKLAEIERKDMPQVKSEDLKSAVLKLSNQCDIRIEKIHVLKIHPTQEDFNKEKVNNIVNSLKSKNKVGPIVVSIENKIVDGHHRWLAAKEIDPSGEINTVKIMLPIVDALNAYASVSKEN